jgi:hypothetical protein
MIEKFARVRGMVRSEFLDLNHTSKLMIPVSLMIPKFAPEPNRRALANFGIGTLAPGGVLEVLLVNTISLA